MGYQEIFKGMIVTFLSGGDINGDMDTYEAFLQSVVTVDFALITAFRNSLRVQISSFVEVPTVAQKAAIVQKVKNTVRDGKAVITSQMGLENAFTESTWRLKAINKDFYDLFDDSEIQTLALIADASVGYQMLSTKGDEIATKYSRAPHVIDAFLKRYRTSESHCHTFNYEKLKKIYIFHSVAYPTGTQQETFTRIYTDYFRHGLAGADLTATNAAFKTYLEDLSMTNAEIDNYIAAIKSYLAIVVANPNQDQKDAITAQLSLFDPAQKDFIESFYGLKYDFSALPGIDPSIYYQKRYPVGSLINGLIGNPDQAYSTFTDPATVTIFTEYLVAAIALSKEIKNKS
jgi:hypothetical protein